MIERVVMVKNGDAILDHNSFVLGKVPEAPFSVHKELAIREIMQKNAS